MALRIDLQPKQRAAWDLMESVPIVFYGGAKGGGKSFLQRAKHVEAITQNDNVTTAIFRRHYKELQTNHIDKIFQEYPDLRDYYRVSKQFIEIPERGSKLYFCHCKDERDLEKYKGLELQLLGIDEVDAFHWQWVVKLMQSARSSNPLFEARVLLTGNPGGRCHHWLKRIFIDRDFRDNERAEDYGFVQALLDDNRHLDKNYENRLNAEPNAYLRRAYRSGDWEIPAGEFFSEFNESVHVIDPLDEEEIKDWFKFGAMDWGHYHPCSFGWFCVNPQTQQVILYREYMDRRKMPNEVKMDLFRFGETKDLRWVVAGRDCWLKQRDGSASVEERFAIADPYRMILDKANMDRKQGWQQVRGFLQHSPSDDEKALGHSTPRFLVTRNCRFTIEGFPRMQHKKLDPEDCETFDCQAEDPIGTGDDQIQMIRYGLMSVPLRGSLKPRLGRQKRLRQYPTRRPKDWRVM